MLLGLLDLDWSGLQWFYLICPIFGFSSQLMSRCTMKGVVYPTRTKQTRPSEEEKTWKIYEGQKEIFYKVRLIDNFTNKKGMTSHCYRIGRWNVYLQMRTLISCSGM